MSFQLRCVHLQREKFASMRAYAGLYFERHSFKKHINDLKLSVNAHMNITHLQDFSRPGNNHLQIPGLFQVFHGRMNPEYQYVPTKNQYW